MPSALPRLGGFSRLIGGNESGSFCRRASVKPCTNSRTSASRVGSAVCSALRSLEHVQDRLVPDLDRGVLHRDQVRDLVVEALLDHPAAVLVRRVQQRGDEPVALVEVGLPVDGVVLVGPRHVPHRGAREGHRRVAGRLGAQAVLGVVPLEEQRQRQPDLVQHRPRDQAHEPAVEVDVGALVQPARRAQVARGEVPVAVAVEAGLHQNRHGCTISPKLCIRDRENRLNMWPPTSVGRRARSPKVTARMTPSGSQTTSSSIIIA